MPRDKFDFRITEIIRQLPVLNAENILASINTIDDQELKTKLLQLFPALQTCIADRKRIYELEKETQQAHVKERNDISVFLDLAEKEQLLTLIMDRLPFGLTDWIPPQAVSSENTLNKLLKTYFADKEHHYWLHDITLRDWQSKHQLFYPNQSELWLYLDLLVTQQVLKKDIMTADMRRGFEDDDDEDDEIKYTHGVKFDEWASTIS